MKRVNFIIVVFAALMCSAVSTCAQSIQKITDQLTVTRIPTEIEVAVDRKDWLRVRSFFTKEVQVDFSTLSGAPPATILADDLVKAWSANLGPKKFSHHQRGNALVSFNGDSATVYSQGYAWNKMEGNGEPLWEVWGNYTHELRKTKLGWKVTGMTFEMTHERGNMWVKNTPSPQ